MLILKHAALPLSLLAALSLPASAAPAPSAPRRLPRQAPAATPNPITLRDAELPEPPQQNAPWQARSEDALSKAVARLFQGGMADPRGLEYREVTLLAGSSTWGGAANFSTHGWALPADAARPGQRFAISWSGLVYPVSSVGALASLSVDAEDLLSKDASARAQVLADRPEMGFHRFVSGWGEGLATAAGSMLPLKAALLLRLGEDDLARRVWASWLAGSSAQEPLHALGEDYLWARLDRALGAHSRGDDRLALADLSAIQASAPLQLELGGTKQAEPSYIPVPLEFLSQVPALLADQKRREVQSRAGSVTKSEEEADRRAPAGSIRHIGWQVRDLQNLDARQWGQPGGVDLGRDARVRALIGAGDPAVPALLDALEHDDRLMRSIQFHRDFFRRRHVLPVSSAAFLILNAIFKTRGGSFGQEYDLGEPAKRVQIAARMRAFWSKYSALTPEQRPFRVLLDDTAGSQAWLDAAQEITRPRNVERVGSVTSTSMAPGADTSLAGESLRSQSAPSVSDLLRRRAQEATSRALVSGTDEHFNQQMSAANGLAQAFALWDADAAAPFVHEQLRRIQRYAAAAKSRYDTSDLLAEAQLSLWRALDKSGSAQTRAQAAEDYAAWLSRQPFASVSPSFLKPLWQRPQQPALQRTAQAMFGSQKSPWGRLLQKSPDSHALGGTEVLRLLTTPMLKVPAFRGAVERALQDRSRAGTCRVRAGGQAEIEVDAGWSTGEDIPQAERARYKVGVQMPFRTCDFIASQLLEPAGQNRGRALCEVYWPQSRRDAGVARALSMLRAGTLYIEPNSPFEDF